MTFHRKYLSILLHIKQELASVDLYVVNSEQYKDYRKGLIDEATYARELPRYAQQVELPLEKPGELIQHLKSKLAWLAQRVDERFPENTYAQIKEGRLKAIINSDPERPSSVWMMPPANNWSQRASLTFCDSERWLNLSDLFYPLSGQQSRVDDPARRFVTTLFCYGCNLGPTQTARSIKRGSALSRWPG